jgi:hypothetical protein
LVAIVPAVVAFLLLAAHFHRAGATLLVAVCVALAVVVCLRRPSWAPRVAQVALVLGSLEWIRTLFAFAADRVALGRPWARLAVILGAVVAFTLLAAWLLQTARARRWYSGGTPRALADARDS